MLSQSVLKFLEVGPDLYYITLDIRMLAISIVQLVCIMISINKYLPVFQICISSITINNNLKACGLISICYG